MSLLLAGKAGGQSRVWSTSRLPTAASRSSHLRMFSCEIGSGCMLEVSSPACRMPYHALSHRFAGSICDCMSPGSDDGTLATQANVSSVHAAE